MSTEVNSAPKKRKSATKRTPSSKVLKIGDERAQRQSCINRIKNELEIFQQLNSKASLESINKLADPKRVILDSKFDTASFNRTIKAQNEQKAAKVQEANAKKSTTGVLSLDLTRPATLRSINSLPISTRTKQGLIDAGYSTLTKIQHASISHTLARQDVMAISCTGSGKTLAFIIPVLESLWQQNWTPQMGLGAIIISPTRELALQTFHVLRRIGKYHNFSAALLVGGNKFEDERKSVRNMNILVCTPGRLMQHVEQSNLDISNICSFVIDEADHLLDAGFAEQCDSLFEALPPSGAKSRHTMLFSATSNPAVSKLAKKALASQPFQISLGNIGTPTSLRHQCAIIDEFSKLDLLYFFLKHHLSCKILIFVATTRQATFLSDLFQLFSQLSFPIMRLHSKLSPNSRLQTFHQFSQAKFGALFCTDVAARGLDIAGVQWVIHFDCPESIDHYVHRSGRTARMHGKGQNLLLLTPAQEPFVGLLRNHYDHVENVGRDSTITISDAEGVPAFRYPLGSKIESRLSANPQLKVAAEKAVISYLQHLVHMNGHYQDLADAYCKRERKTHSTTDIVDDLAKFCEGYTAPVTNTQQQLSTDENTTKQQRPTKEKPQAYSGLTPEQAALLEKNRTSKKSTPAAESTANVTHQKKNLHAVPRDPFSLSIIGKIASESSAVNPHSSYFSRIMGAVFDPQRYDLVGLCQNYGLDSVPLIDLGSKTGDNSDDEDEAEAAAEAAAAAEKQRHKKHSADGDDADETIVLHRQNPLHTRFCETAKQMEELDEDDDEQNAFQLVPVQNSRYAIGTLNQASTLPHHSNQLNKTPFHAMDLAFIQSKDTSSSSDDDDSDSDDSSDSDSDSDDSDDDSDSSDDQTKSSKTVVAKKAVPLLNIGAIANDRLLAIQQRYSALDSADKTISKERAQKRRKWKQNMRLLEQLRARGVELTLDELDDYLASQKRQKDDVSDDDQDDDFDDDDDNDQNGDDDDDDDDDDNALLMDDNYAALLNDDDDDDDDDVDESSEEETRIPAKKQRTSAPVAPKSTKQVSLTAKQAFSLDESDDDSD